jgi:hypothetical protein
MSLARLFGALAMAGLLSLAGCSDSAAPSTGNTSLTIEGVVADSAGNAIPGAVVAAWLNSFDSSWTHGLYFSDIMTDSLGRYRVHFDSLLEPLDSVLSRFTPPGCYWGAQSAMIRSPQVPAIGSFVVTQDIVLAHTQPRASGVVGQLCGMVSDEGAAGYSGWLQVLIEQSVSAPTGGAVLTGRWTIYWSPSYGGSDGTFTGLATNSMVDLLFQDTTDVGPGSRCPRVRWIAPVDAAGAWGILVPSVEGGGTCRWATFPIMLTRDTATGPWP